ncbi:DUF3592 domain-containing protein [Flavobacterium procerum]|uniref:DUF3592 domain-containing protein n=1 Tax=Flavobacterium procerum TaxID=1455569 RepID=A0ABV6BMW6_9FLAO
MLNFDKKYWIILIVTFIFCMFFKPVLCFLILGTFALGYACYSLVFLNKINKNGIEIDGRILSYESDSEGYKTPVIEFQIAAGIIITGKPFLHTSTDLDKFRTYSGNINKTIKIIYSPDNPQRFILKNSFNGFGMVLFIIVGLVFLGISIGNLLGYNAIFN